MTTAPTDAELAAILVRIFDDDSLAATPGQSKRIDVCHADDLRISAWIARVRRGEGTDDLARQLAEAVVAPGFETCKLSNGSDPRDRVECRVCGARWHATASPVGPAEACSCAPDCPRRRYEESRPESHRGGGPLSSAGRSG